MVRRTRDDVMEEAGSSSAEVEPPPPRSAYEAASYIADLTSELAKLARGARLDFLAYLLDVAKLEAAAGAESAGSIRRRS